MMSSISRYLACFIESRVVHDMLEQSCLRSKSHLGRLAQKVSKKVALNARSNSAKQAVRQHIAARDKELGTSIPTVPECPSPTCECADMPEDLDIDTSQKLNGTMVAYSQQILVSTGQADWKSKIEEEEETAPWGGVVAKLKSMLGPKGRYHDPYRNIVVSTSSFDPPQSNSSPQALLFPSFHVVNGIDPSNGSIAKFIELFVLPNDTEERTQNIQKEPGSSQNSWQQAGLIHPITTPTILVCSHHSRDSRCGVLGPLLHAEFTQYINKRHTLRNQAISEQLMSQGKDHQEDKTFASHPQFRPDLIDAEHQHQQPINIGMISHIGGHKWAGNVIVYIPPDYRINALERARRGAKPKDRDVTGSEEPIVHEDQPLSTMPDSPNVSPLAGRGIWYGRVQPKHVEGIVEQTIGHGTIIKDLFRGGINRNGSTIRI